MTNKERQASLDKKKWLVSEHLNCDCSGTMEYCEYCAKMGFADFSCEATQEERESQCLCAKAYNRMKRAKNDI